MSFCKETRAMHQKSESKYMIKCIYVFLRKSIATGKKRITSRLIIHRSKSIHRFFIGDITGMLYTIGIILQVYYRSIGTLLDCVLSHIRRKQGYSTFLFIRFINLIIKKSPFIQFGFAFCHRPGSRFLQSLAMKNQAVSFTSLCLFPYLQFIYLEFPS